VLTSESPILAALVVQPLTPTRIKQVQEDDLDLQELIEEAKRGEASGFYIANDGVLKTKDDRTVVPNDADLRREILDETHHTRYTIHPGNTKMYQDLKKNFWWNGMKRNIAKVCCTVPIVPTCKSRISEARRSTSAT
jgi:hypothetical protein